MTVLLHVVDDSVVEEELEWFSLSLDLLSVPVDRVHITQPTATVFIEDKNS